MVSASAGLIQSLKTGKAQALQRYKARAGLKPSLYNPVFDFQGGVQFVRGDLCIIHSMVCDPEKG
jgi:hypothetical protein